MRKKAKNNYSFSLRELQVDLIDRLILSGEIPEWKNRSRSQVVDMLLEEALIRRLGDRRFNREVLGI